MGVHHPSRATPERPGEGPRQSLSQVEMMAEKVRGPWGVYKHSPGMGNSPEIEVCFFLTEAFKMQICVEESYLHLSILNWN